MPTRSRSARACTCGLRSFVTSGTARCATVTPVTIAVPTAKIRRRAASCCQREHYLTTTSLNATRGCHNRCGFCYLSTAGLHMPYQLRDPAQIVEEILADGQPYAVFTDNNLGSRPAYLRELCRALKPIERIWSAAVSLDITDHPDVVREMALAGCTGVFVGLESLQAENITDQRKKSPRPEDYARRVALLHDLGIQVNASFVLGFDHDRPDVFERTAEWVEQNRVECATFHILTPYPGTPLFRQFEAEGRLLHRDWTRYDTAHVVFQSAAHDGRAASSRATPGATGACSRTRRSGRDGRATPRRCRRTWRCRISTSARTGSGRF